MSFWLEPPFQRLKLFLYCLLSSAEPGSIRRFKFGVPLVIKRTPRLVSTEADALAFLNSTGLDLPIPRLVDTKSLAVEDLQKIIDDILAVLHQLWTLQQPPCDSGKVMLSASGHGLPDGSNDKDTHAGPCPSILDCYVPLTHHLKQPGDPMWSAELLSARQPELIKAVTSDRIAWVAGDLRPHNILILDGRLSGIIDWQDSGWLPLHWQLHALRNPCMGNPLSFCNLWRKVKFSKETEEAFEASCKLLRSYVV
ncbi:uncharacterized protein STEHIDRAFT_171296 [Stereum hirsutum FP-91666 SS1]|uniref:uncharacterized protein n=1 Tax=Stereum hirsutum (strain FP-91666) TaxID=721885 RepID=UPI000444A0FF|nr:uncharacterized protein STEHIDRAFT_171296 [Stereum hirsutum FP-91666 SS1]EIM82350.1 hypothetical protein STEHIDRAFT_171296 [Stereum hirsutum FP-91666 SS1]